MAFFRFNRDKRGYEHFYLVQSTTNRRGKVRSRVLYWFRTPPGVRVGREPFDEGVRRALEAQYPEILFDWPAILDAPIPSADADKWRERRRAEKVARHIIESAIDTELEDEPPGEIVDVAVFSPQLSPPPPEEHAAAAPAIAAALNPPAPIVGDANRKRRRRRRGRRAGASTQPDQTSQPDAVPEPAGGDEPGEPNGD
jgi:hypothetical protein